MNNASSKALAAPALETFFFTGGIDRLKATNATTQNVFVALDGSIGTQDTVTGLGSNNTVELITSATTVATPKSVSDIQSLAILANTAGTFTLDTTGWQGNTPTDLGLKHISLSDTTAGTFNLTLTDFFQGSISLGGGNDKVAGLILNGSGAYNLNAAGVHSLQTIDASKSKALIQANLSGTDAAFLGSTGENFVTIDHAPTAIIKSGNPTGVFNDVTINSPSFNLNTLTVAAEQKIKGFLHLNLEGGLTDGQTLDAAGFDTILHEIHVNAKDIPVAGQASGVTFSNLMNDKANIFLDINQSFGAPIVDTDKNAHLTLSISGSDIVNTITAGGAGGTLVVGSSVFGGYTDHLALNTDATTVDFSHSFGNLDLTGSTWTVLSTRFIRARAFSALP